MKAPMYLEVEVTKDDLANGTPASTLRCPIALAVKRTYGDAPMVGYGTIRIDFENGLAEYDMDRWALRFIRRFDHLKWVRPHHFTFKLRGVQE